MVSCNTTSIARTLGTLKDAGLLERTRGTLLRRAADPWESHLGGIMNTVMPEPEVPSHRAPDARTVDSDLDVVTAAVKIPETLGHVHLWSVDLTTEVTADDVRSALEVSSRIARVRTGDGLGAVNAVKELALDLGRSRGDLYEVVLWDEIVTVRGRELYFGYMVDNQAIVIPETVDAILALSGGVKDPLASIRATDEALGVRGGPWGQSQVDEGGSGPAGGS